MLFYLHNRYMLFSRVSHKIMQKNVDRQHSSACFINVRVGEGQEENVVAGKRHQKIPFEIV